MKFSVVPTGWSKRGPSGGGPNRSTQCPSKECLASAFLQGFQRQQKKTSTSASSFFKRNINNMSSFSPQEKNKQNKKKQQRFCSSSYLLDLFGASTLGTKRLFRHPPRLLPRGELHPSSALSLRLGRKAPGTWPIFASKCLRKTDHLGNNPPLKDQKNQQEFLSPYRSKTQKNTTKAQKHTKKNAKPQKHPKKTPQKAPGASSCKARPQAQRIQHAPRRTLCALRALSAARLTQRLGEETGGYQAIQPLE